MTQKHDAAQKAAEAPARRGLQGEPQQAEMSRQHLLTRLQRTAGNRAVSDWLHDDGAARQGVHLEAAQMMIQTKPANGQASHTAAEATQSTAPTVQSSPLLVEDEAEKLQSGQMRKSDFLSQLRVAVCSTADEALASAGRDTRGCPYIEQWFSHYADKNAEYVERSLRKYAPEAREATSARDYIPAVCNRVRRGIEVWVKTGEITGVPDELAGMIPGAGGIMGALGAVSSMIGSAVSGIVSGIGSAVSGIVSGVGQALSGIGSIFKKESGGGSVGAESANPNTVQSQLSAGRSLDGTVQARMSAAFGYDFSDVRVHTDGKAAELSDKLSARAFTVGSDIAFSAGEYQPGTLIGDALIAHELAHVVQQRGGVHAAGREPMRESQSLETEADDAAVSAVLSLHSDSSAVPRSRLQLSSLKTGLRLQRCGGGPYSDTELQTYLEKLGNEGVQGGLYGDNRARGVVGRWKESVKGFDLTPHLKYLLIEEMLTGSTGGDDERAILDLLELSDNGDLRLIFAKEGLTVKELDGSIDGDNYKELLAFYEERFEGGRAALLQGRIAPKGAPKQGAPHFPYSWASLEKRLFEMPYLSEDIAGYVRSLTPDEQAQARRDLNDKRVQYQKKVDEVYKILEAKVKAAATAAGKKPADIDPFDVALEEMDAYRENLRKVERIEAVLNIFGLETAKLGVKAAEAAAVAPKTQAEKDALKAMVKPPPPPAGAFTDKAGYETELTTAVKQLVNDLHKAFVQNVNRTDTYSLDRLAQIANAGWKAVNDAFGAQWGTGPKFVPNVNLVDLYVDVETTFQSIPLAQQPAALKQSARDKILKLMAADKSLRAVNRKFKASPEFDEQGNPSNDEAKIQVKIADDISTTDAQRVFEIIRGWPGAHREGKVKFQTTKQPAGEKERRHFWRLFQTAIHEYIHSLMNGEYRAYAESFPGGSKSREYNTLVEGMATVFHEMVWQSVQPKLRTKALRDDVEGQPYAGQPFDESVIPEIKDIRYGSYEEAQALIARVGITNVMLAFFKGRVELIGGEKPKPKP